MKKIFLCLCLICLILTGCGKKDEATILKEFQNLVEETESYYLTGNMELVKQYTLEIS